MIRFDHVTRRYGTHDALDGVSFEVAEGELVFLTGRSGAGKSTLLRLLALIEKPTRGQVLVDNHNIARLDRRRIAPYRRQIGMVFQDNRLLNDRNAFENVALPLVIAGVSARETGKRVRAALDQVGLLDRERLTPLALSAGEQQRLGIARAIVTRPRLLIADEPTGNLDPDLSLEIMTMFRRFNQAGVTMLIATHDVGLLGRIGGSRITLADGRVVDHRREARA